MRPLGSVVVRERGIRVGEGVEVHGRYTVKRQVFVYKTSDTCTLVVDSVSSFWRMLVLLDISSALV